ncbi:MAG TPA: endonuclease/exonuclease/phosphatase family protein [Longimicrobiales bacterium]|nr:endonuclease/exonuclease/phosphatase family protein [Longimicrobiales bacterium]
MSRHMLLLTGILLASSACADGYEGPTAPVHETLAIQGALGPTVMTRNVFLGADLNPIIQAASPLLIPGIAAEVWARIQASNFPARAGALADEIARTSPHLVGLQEAVLYHIQSPGDAAAGGQTPATTVAYDFVQLLVDSLEARGLSYDVVAEVTGTVVELPVYTGLPPFPFDDVRFTDREVILARSDVPVSNPQGGVFAARLNLPIGGPGGPLLSQQRGWASVDATVYDHTFRFISTHLEVQAVAPIQVMQGAELVAIATASPLPVVMVGDFNSAADGTQTPTYGNIVAAGFEDVWNRAGHPGYTCCHAEDLLNEQSTLDQRLDVVFVRGFRTAPQGSIGARVQLVGDRSVDRLSSGLWPADHAGVVASLRLPPAAVAQQ